MKYIYLLFTFVICFFGNANAQCSPNIIYTILGIPGVYPLPQLTGLSDGTVSSTYTETLTLVSLQDTNMDISSLLPASVVIAMNLAGISPTMNVSVNHSTYDITGLPNGLSYQCSDPNCQYAPANDGCILISGIPTEGGDFTININQTLNVQIPPIATLFAGMAVDVPAYSAQEYDLFIDGSATAISEVTQNNFLYPNPTANEAKLSLLSISDVLVYNILGKEVLKTIDFKGELILSKNDLGKGMFYVMVKSEKRSETIKLIIK